MRAYTLVLINRNYRFNEFFILSVFEISRMFDSVRQFTVLHMRFGKILIFRHYVAKFLVNLIFRSFRILDSG